jgi:histidinol-phosphate aminotransferase
MIAILLKREKMMNKFWSQMTKRATPYIPGEQLNEKDILKLNTNENPYPPSPNVLDAIRDEVGKDLRLYPSPTGDVLRDEIAAYYGLEKENVFVGNGSDEVLAFAFMAFFDPGKTIKFPAITYSFYPVYANVFGIGSETVPLCDDFSLDVTKFFDAEGGVIFPNPNAPTSVYLPLEQVEEILKANPEKVVIVDEAYMDFAPGESAASLVQRYGNLLVIQTMSKSRSLAGLRLGFALGNEGLIQALVRMKDSFNSYPIDRLAMAGATAAIRDRDYFEKTTAAIVKTREWTTTKLKQLGFHVLPSATNFVFASHPDVTAEVIYEALRDKGILIRYFATKPIDDYVRISIGTDDEMKRFVDELTTISLVDKE